MRETGGITIEDLRIVLTGRRSVDVVDDIDLVLHPARWSAWSASPAPARPPSARRCSATPGRCGDRRAARSLFEDKDVLALPWQQVRKLRGEEIAYVPQDPAAALNPASGSASRSSS